MIKQVIVIRTDLNISKGKIVTHASHACVNSVLKAAARSGGFLDWDFRDNKAILVSMSGRGSNSKLNEWFENKYVKTCVSVNSEEELLNYNKKINDAGYVTELIKTRSSYTCFAVEPLEADIIDAILGDLPPY